MPNPSNPYLNWLDNSATPPKKISQAGWKKAANILINRMRAARKGVLTGEELPALSSYVRTYSQITSLLSWVEFTGSRSSCVKQKSLEEDLNRIYRRRDLIEASWSKTNGKHILDGLLRRRGARRLSHTEREMVSELRQGWQNAGCAESISSSRRQQQALTKHYKRREKYQQDCLENGIYLSRRQAYEIPQPLRRQARAQSRLQKKNNSWFITADSSLADEVIAHLSDRSTREALWRQKQAFRESNVSVSNILSMRHQDARLEGYKDYASYQFSSHAVGRVKTVQSLLNTFLERSAPAQARYERRLLSLAHQEGLDQIQPWDRSWLIEKSKSQSIQEPDQAFSIDCLVNIVIPELLALGSWQVEEISCVGQGARKRWCYDLVYGPGQDYIDTLSQHSGDTPPSPRRAQVWFAPYNPGAVSDMSYGGYELCVRDRWNSLGAQNTSHAFTDDLPSEHEDNVQALSRQIVYVCLMLNPDTQWARWHELSWVIHEIGHVLHDLALLPIQHNYSYLGAADMVEFPSQLLEALAQDPRLLVKWAKASVGSDRKARNISFWTRWIQSQDSWLGSTRTQAIDGLVDLDIHKMVLSPGQVVDVQEIYRKTCHKYLVDCHDDDRTVFQGFTWDGYGSCYYSYTFGQILSRSLISRRKDMTINGERVKKVFVSLLDEVLCVGIDGHKFSRAWRQWKGETLRDSLARGTHLYAKDMDMFSRASSR